MVKTSFWSPEGKPISAEEFIKNLFGDIPGFFQDETHLRHLWSLPDTRKKLLAELSERGYTEPQLRDLQQLVRGEDSDQYDVLAYIAWHRDMIPRAMRAECARVFLRSYDPAQQEFLNFVLQQYIRGGVEELDDTKLPELLELKYKALADAKAVLGDVGRIRDIFREFQGYLYAGAG